MRIEAAVTTSHKVHSGMTVYYGLPLALYRVRIISSQKVAPSCRPATAVTRQVIHKNVAFDNQFLPYGAATSTRIQPECDTAVQRKCINLFISILLRMRLLRICIRLSSESID